MDRRNRTRGSWFCESKLAYDVIGDPNRSFLEQFRCLKFCLQHGRSLVVWPTTCNIQNMDPLQEMNELLSSCVTTTGCPLQVRIPQDISCIRFMALVNHMMVIRRKLNCLCEPYPLLERWTSFAKAQADSLLQKIKK